MFKDKRGYIYRKKRVNGQVITEYVGSGRKSGAAQKLLQKEKRQKASEQKLRQKEQDLCTQTNRVLHSAETGMALLHESCELLVNMALVQAGFHRHARGAWRKKRVLPAWDNASEATPTQSKLYGGNMQRPVITAEQSVSSKEEELDEENLDEEKLDVDREHESTSALLFNKKRPGQEAGQIEETESRAEDGAGIERPAPAAAGIAMTRAELRDLAQQAPHDEMAAARLVKLLEKIGQADAYFSTVRDAASNARHSLIELCCPNDKLAAMGMERRLNAMQDELAGPDATALEKQLAERIALCWLQVHYFESMYALHASDAALSTLYQNRLDAAHKRHLGAIKAMAQVRKLQIPVLQFNLAEQQVNIAQMNPPLGQADS